MTEPSLTPIRRALLSVSDKTGLAEFGRALAAYGIEILSTGGTAATLRDAGVPIVEVADHTDFPEIMGGRVKTLHPTIHGGLLGRRDHAADQAEMDRHAIAPIDLLVSNLYPFEQTVVAGADHAACIENIDIGGPAMTRAAAKNHRDVTVITDPADYAALLEEMAANDGCTGWPLRRRFAAKAFARTAQYDAAIAHYLLPFQDQDYPQHLPLPATLKQPLRYGENPHQSAALYITQPPRPGVVNATQLQGKALSYNNLGDADAALELVAEFDAPAVVIVKHANPCGVAMADDLIEAYRRALSCDTQSAFGGIVATNRPLDEGTAQTITEIFTEVVIAPGADDAAREVFAAKKNLRLLLVDEMPDPAGPGIVIRSLAGGLLVQQRDTGHSTAADLKTVTKRPPTAQEQADLLFAATVAKHTKSNAIIYAKNGTTVGIGAGQMSRVDAAAIAARKAEHAAQLAGETTSRTAGSAAASEAFFPFADGLQAVIAAGATAVIQPGGSMRDAEVIAAADAAGIAMVFTGMRHFRH
ncbi:MAG: bifunctional phosphoribosylaminoimidazolecarboxamide formyltransferase/IMP cyclohydrolase [Alphaproteobacteria bacterium]